MTSAEKLLQLVNEANIPKRLLTTLNVSLSEVSEDTSVSDKNTVLKLSGVPGRGYSGNVNVHYRRINLSQVLGDQPLRSTELISKARVVQMINQAYGLFLVPEDLQDVEVPNLSDANPQGVMSIIAAVDSIGFMGSIELTLQYGRSWLDAVVNVRILPTLNHPIVPSVRRSTRMLTWNKDFTCIAEAIKPDKLTGTYTDWSLLQTVASHYGIPAWPQGRVRDLATSEVADSNPAFERVIVQPAVYTAELEGPIYLHYNVI